MYNKKSIVFHYKIRKMNFPMIYNCNTLKTQTNDKEITDKITAKWLHKKVDQVIILSTLKIPEPKISTISHKTKYSKKKKKRKNLSFHFTKLSNRNL
ncbi:hypothetical protein CICLE_v10026838mg [Citrus x clementina]|uniref:Uncharacterized protein n=1 Tax=Citrus clementina TaxID=85681 RepID=V4RYD2_CITCL|nr:hypothetical protein CICLE_v10026838mg [Citrus x clementina]